METPNKTTTVASVSLRFFPAEVPPAKFPAIPAMPKIRRIELRMLGVRLSIDDFGTGYTSLSFLRDLPVQEIKIDRSFVTNMLTHPKDAIIVRTGVELAHRLGLASVAEGIEDAETYAALAALGCTTAQGFHLGRPMPGHVFDNWLSDWNVAQEIAGQAAFVEPTLAPNR